MNSKTGSILCLVLVLSTVAGCGSGSADPQQEATEATAETTPTIVEMEVAAVSVPGDLIGTWILVAIDGAPVTEVGKTPTLEVFEEGSVAGVGGVNRFNTKVEIVGGRLSFGPVAATKMAGPPEAMDLESTYLARLGAVSSYVVEDGTLRLWAGDNEALTFGHPEIEP